MLLFLFCTELKASEVLSRYVGFRNTTNVPADLIIFCDRPGKEETKKTIYKLPPHRSVYDHASRFVLFTGFYAVYNKKNKEYLIKEPKLKKD